MYLKNNFVLTNIDYNYMPNNYTVIIRALEGKGDIIPPSRNYKFVFRNTKKADDVTVYKDYEQISYESYVDGPNFIVEVNDVPTFGHQLTFNCKGIESSIDDFGVGYSSLSYLPQLPFSEIKIDRSFINEMAEPGMLAVVQTIIQLAKNINMRAIAEGIETKEQLTMLQQLGCPAGQGFYFYKPMPIEEAEKLLES